MIGDRLCIRLLRTDGGNSFSAIASRAGFKNKQGVIDKIFWSYLRLDIAYLVRREIVLVQGHLGVLEVS